MRKEIKPVVSGLLATLFIVLLFAANADLPGKASGVLTDLCTARTRAACNAALHNSFA
jgi:hypothetical protein